MRMLAGLAVLRGMVSAVLILVSIVGGRAACGGSVWHVQAGAAGGDGRSWPQALPSLQRAIDLSSPGDQIWVAGGTYRPERLREVEGEYVFASSFVLKDGVSVLGGFRGDEDSPEQRRLRDGGIYGWEFRHKTILEQHPGGLGSVIRGAPGGHVLGGEVNGLVVKGGRALGAEEEGCGGGLWGVGRLTVRRCLFEGNVARAGGGLHWNGPLTLMCVGFFDNELVSEGWGGHGGGAWISGNGYNLSGVICVGNGCAKQGVQRGGGLCLSGCGKAIHCTLVGNRAVQSGSGAMVCGASVLGSSLVWGNLGSPAQVALEGGQVVSCGIEGWMGSLDDGSIPLSHDNAGAGGVAANDNQVSCYYPCFLSVAKRDFRLGAGSYALNRGVGTHHGLDALGRSLDTCLPGDLGACGSRFKGNLALAISVGYPHLYGGVSGLSVCLGAGAPSNVQVVFDVAEGKGCLEEVAMGDWRICWEQSGAVMLESWGRVEGKEAMHWHELAQSRRIDVQPRPLLVVSGDEIWQPGTVQPSFRWSLAGGRLVYGDSLTGRLKLGHGSENSGMTSIIRGTLSVNDGHDGRHYRVHFLEGILYHE